MEYMEFLIELIFLLAITSIQADTKSCTDISRVPQLVQNVKVESESFHQRVSPGPMSCALHCMRRSLCQSFNYHTVDGQCLLFHFNSSDESFKSTTNTDYIFANVSSWPKNMLGGCRGHTCGLNEVCIPVTPASYSCNSSGKPSTCGELQECNPPLPDGDYWLHLEAFSERRVRVYCHLMNTTTPASYVSLVKPNTGYYPDVENTNCEGETPLAPERLQYAGTRVFHKIKINLLTLRVDVYDVTFASDVITPKPYGISWDCYSNQIDGNLSSCGIKGNFTIDLTDTGLIVSPTVEWGLSGNNAFMSVEKISPSVINLYCGGKCGGCKANDGLFLKLSNEELPLTAAQEVFCYPPGNP